MKLPDTPPRQSNLFRQLSPERFEKLFIESNGSTHRTGPYLHWDDLRRRSPPPGLSHEEWWLATKLSRANRSLLPLADAAGRPFTFTVPDAALALLHRIDQKLGGNLALSDPITNPATRDRYLVSSLAEEAIRSSQLEGASTTRQVAREMLRTGRTPHNRGEKMIANNFRVMRSIGETRQDPLTPARICELQRMVTEGTLDEPAAAGRLQLPSDVRVHVWDGDQVLHVPPPAEQLPRRMKALCAFANPTAGQPWIHPVLRAITLHFWLAYDHPFEDGNGRTARALFYWSMLAQGYWVAEFLSLSTVLKKAPAQYARSFLLTETDDNDLTYFMLAQLEVISRSIDAFETYLQRKLDELRSVELLVSANSGLNHRQRALLGTALRDPDSQFTIAGHQATHKVVYQTARADLLDLEKRRLLSRQLGRGKAFSFRVPPDLSARLKGAQRGPTNY